MVIEGVIVQGFGALLTGFYFLIANNKKLLTHGLPCVILVWEDSIVERSFNHEINLLNDLPHFFEGRFICYFADRYPHSSDYKNCSCNLLLVFPSPICCFLCVYISPLPLYRIISPDAYCSCIGRAVCHHLSRHPLFSCHHG